MATRYGDWVRSNDGRFFTNVDGLATEMYPLALPMKPVKVPATAKLGSWFKNNFGWDKYSGATLFGKNIGKLSNIAVGGTNAFEALSGLQNLSKVNEEKNEILSDILRSSASNPLASDFLTSEQRAMLRQIKRGTYDSDADLADNLDIAGLLSAAGSGAISGIAGGIPGMLIGAAGGAINNGLQQQQQAQQLTNEELEGLLQALTDAEEQYQMMKRPNLTGLGIQQRYKDMYY